MTPGDIVRRRLTSQRLEGDPLAGPVDVIGWFGAVQAQDYPAAKWAVAQRTAGATDAELDRLFDAGAILRTHVLRPTWHFVAPEDARWLAALTGPRVLAGLKSRHRWLELDDRTIAKAEAAFATALREGKHLTRPELGDVLVQAGISPEGQRLPHLLMVSELSGLLTSGARRGKQHTWALLDERAPGTPRLSQEEALAKLAQRYLQSHAPATAKDFSWWSGLTLAQAKRAIALAGEAPEVEPASGVSAHLLPNFDEFTVAYSDRSAVLDPRVPFDASIFSFGSVLANVAVVGGTVRGSWRRTNRAQGVTVEVQALSPLAPGEKSGLRDAGRRFAEFLERPVEVSL